MTYILTSITKRLFTWRTVLSVVFLAIAFHCDASAQSEPPVLTPTQVDQVLDRLQAALLNYVFPDVAAKLREEIHQHSGEYRTMSDPTLLTNRLTADMQAVGHDQHLAVSYGEELGLEKAPTPEEKLHSHLFDVANGYGVRSARRLPGNIGYIDLAYFSPDPNVGDELAAVMQLISGTDALIIDLRRNGGGSSDAALDFMSYFFEDQTQLSSTLQHVDGKIKEKQHWTIALVHGPRYIDKPVFILTGAHTHSAAEWCAYDLKSTHHAILVGERTSGAANGSTGTIALGYGLTALIPDSQVRSPFTNSNWEGSGVLPDISTAPAEALGTAYALALKDAKPSLHSDELEKERAAAEKDTKAALLQEIDGFPSK